MFSTMRRKMILPRQKRLSRGLLIEPLEDRRLLANIVWDGEAGDNDWNNAVNWHDQTNNIPNIKPGPNDDAQIIGFSGLIVSDATETIRSVTSDAGVDLGIVSGTFTIGSGIGDTSLIDGTLVLSGGSLAGSGTLNVNALDWSGGSQTGSGHTNISSGGTLSISGGSLSRTINNAGVATWVGGNIGSSSGVFNNFAGAIFDVQSNHSFDPSVNNSGTLRKSQGNSSQFRNGMFNTSGLVDVQAGTLVLSSSGISTGDWNVAQNATLEFSHTFNAPVRTISLAADKTISGDGKVKFSGGTNAIEGNGTFNVTGSTEIVAGTVNLNLDLAAATTHFVQSNGTLAGSADIHVGESMTLSGGIHGGAGATNIPAQKTLLISGGSLSRTINNAGVATWVGGNIGSSSGVFNNFAGAIFDVQSNHSFDPSVNNSGTLRKSQGNSSQFRNGTFDTSGLVDVQAGTLLLSSSGISTGDWNVAQNATLEFSHTSNTPVRTISLAAENSIRSKGTVRFSGGTNTIDGDGTFSVMGTTEIVAGTVNLNLNLVAATTHLVQSNGTLTGPADIDVGESMTWSGGTHAGTGETNVPRGGTLNIAGGSLGRTLNNSGTASWTASNIGWQAGGVFNNRAGATFDVQADAGILANVNNYGTLRKTAGTGTSSFTGSFVNNGVLEVLTGTLAVDQGVMVFDGGHVLKSNSSATLSVSGNLVGATSNADFFAPAGVLRLVGGSAASPQLLEVMGRNVGALADGYLKNFAYGQLEMIGYNQLVDHSDNRVGVDPEALYVNNLVVPSGSTLDLNGLDVYARSTLIQGQVIGGVIHLVEDGGSIHLNSPTSGAIASDGEVDEWTFFGRGGRAVTVVGNPGAGAVNNPLSPTLDFAEVELLDPNGNILDAGRNTTIGEKVTLLALELPIDGVYRVRMHASPSHPNNIGNYMLTVWDATVDVRPLVLNQQHHGLLETPFAVDRWTFSAQANTQVRFDWINALGPSTSFRLTGPNGFVGFAGLTGDSDLVTLPEDGGYVLDADGADFGAGYVFQMHQTNQTDLIPGVPYNGTLSGTGHTQLFRISLPDPERLYIALDDSSSENRNELYVRFGSPPTRSEYDYAFSNPGADQQLLVPNQIAGDWYVLLYGVSTLMPSGYTLTATAGDLFLAEVTPDHHGESADAVLTITGTGFDSTATVSLIAADTTEYPAETVSLDIPTQLTASFAAGTVPPGVYALRVNRGDDEVTELVQAFTILSGGGASIETNLVLPDVVGRHQLATILVEYANTGTVATPAPILVLSATDQAFMTLDESRLVEGLWTSAIPDGFSDTVQFLASGVIPGVLQPGESGSVPVYYAGLQPPWNPGDNRVEFALTVTTIENDELVDWDGLEDQVRPERVTSETWGPIWDNFATQTGTTWGDYVRRFSGNATYLSQLGQTVIDVGDLLDFALFQVGELSPRPEIGYATDAALPAPGLELTFDRFFQSSMLGRNLQGPLGRGWTHNWQSSLEVLADGTVVIEYGTAGARRFQPDSRGGDIYFAENGDFDTLTPIPGGGFSLRTVDGTREAYRADGRLDYVEDANGNRITAAFSGNQLTSLMHSSGQSLTFAYNAAALIQSVTDSFGRQTTYTYDPANEHLIQVQRLDTGITSYTYGLGAGSADEHALLSILESTGVQRFYTYDAMGRMASAYLGDHAEELAFEYDLGTITTTDASGNENKLFHGVFGIPVKQENPLGAVEFATLDGDFQVNYRSDSSGNSFIYSYDAQGNLTQVKDRLGNPTRLVYGDLGRPSVATDRNGNVTEYIHDGQGNLLHTVYADGTRESQAYDAFGNSIGFTNRRGQAINFVYNSKGQVTRKTLANGSQVDFTYDTHGNVETMTDATGATAFQYNSGDRLTRVTYPSGRFLQYTYDAGGRRTSIADSDGMAVLHEYDAAGRLRRVADQADATIVTYDFDAAGRLVREDHGNGTYSTYAYDAAGEIVQIIHRAADDSINARLDYTYDLLGRRTGLTTLDGAWTYEFDAMDQLTAAVFASVNPLIADQDLEYSYDAAGNRIQTIINGVTSNYTVNHLNQYTQIGSSTYSYDLDGNIISKSDAGGTTLYSYDSENRLLSAVGPVGSLINEYDGQGNRVAMTRNGQRIEFLLDPLGMVNVIGEYDGAGDRTAFYAHGIGLTARIDSAGVASYYDFDGIGSTVGISSLASDYVNSYSYLPFGELLFETQTIQNAFQFVGVAGVSNETDGMLFMRNRFYASELGTFTSIDPLRLPTTNLYTYVENNPTHLVDPLGLRGGLAGMCFTEENGFVPCDNVEPEPPPKKKCGLHPVVLGAAIQTGNVDGAVAACGGGSGANPPGPPGDPGGAGSSGTAGAVDPNQKIGPAGFGPAGFVRADSAFVYKIDFENLESATAPAQRVVVTDQLDANLDWETVQLTNVGFGDHFIAIPAGRDSYDTVVAINQNDQDIEVHITIWFDRATGRLSATFQSIIPDTGLPPDVLTGFLPPEDGTGRGQGFIGYSVRPQAGLPTGSETKNIALITFDTNQPIATNQIDPLDPSLGTDPELEARNTIDAEAPTSSVDPLLPTNASTTILLTWSSDDGLGSGAQTYDLFVSIDGAAFVLLLDDTADLAFSFLGMAGSTYSFYTRATDGVGYSQTDAVDIQTTMIVDNPGDFDTDGDLDGADIDALVAAIASGSDDPIYDISGDRIVNITDRDVWLQLAGAANLPSGNAYLLGDANLDGFVDGLDFILWNANKFTSTPAWTAGDFNVDGIVDGEDFIIWNEHKFQNAAVVMPPLRSIRRSRLLDFEWAFATEDDAVARRLIDDGRTTIVDEVFRCLR